MKTSSGSWNILLTDTHATTNATHATTNAHTRATTCHRFWTVDDNNILFLGLNCKDFLTCESWRTQTGKSPHSVHAGGSVPARLWSALVHIYLAVSTLEAWHAEAGVAVPTVSAYSLVLARVWEAVVHSWRLLVKGCTWEHITFRNKTQQRALFKDKCKQKLYDCKDICNSDTLKLISFLSKC